MGLRTSGLWCWVGAGSMVSLTPCCSDANWGVPFPRTGTAASLGFSELTGSEGIWGGAGTISKSASLPKGCGALRKGRWGQRLRWGEIGFQPPGWKVTWRGLGAAAVPVVKGRCWAQDSDGSPWPLPAPLHSRQINTSGPIHFSQNIYFITPLRTSLSTFARTSGMCRTRLHPPTLPRPWRPGPSQLVRWRPCQCQTSSAAPPASRFSVPRPQPGGRR